MSPVSVIEYGTIQELYIHLYGPVYMLAKQKIASSLCQLYRLSHRLGRIPPA